MAVPALITMLIAAGCPDDNGREKTEEEDTTPQIYSISVTPSTNGTITASPTSATAGSVITLSISPANNTYALVQSSLTVQTSAIFVSVSGSGSTFAFIMPAADVTVSGQFGVISGFAGIDYVPVDNKEEITLSRNNNSDLVLGSDDSIIVTAPSNYDFDYYWFIDGELFASGVNMYTVTIPVTNPYVAFVGRHTVTVVVQKGDIFYSGDLTFNVVWRRDN